MKITSCPIHVFLLDIDPILPNFHFTSFDRCWSHNQDFHFTFLDRFSSRIQDFHLIEVTNLGIHVFWEIWIPYSENCQIPISFSDRYWSYIQDFQQHERIFSFPRSRLFHFFKNDVQACEIIKNNIIENEYGFLGFLKVSWCHGHVRKLKIIKMKSFWFPQSEIEKLSAQNEAK